jgi:ribosomal protein S27E
MRTEGSGKPTNLQGSQSLTEGKRTLVILVFLEVSHVQVTCRDCVFPLGQTLLSPTQSRVLCANQICAEVMGVPITGKALGVKIAKRNSCSVCSWMLVANL